MIERNIYTLYLHRTKRHRLSRENQIIYNVMDWPEFLGPLLLTWINFNPSMDK